VKRRPVASKLRALSPLRFSIIGLAILIIPKLAQRVMCSMAKTASPSAICADHALPTIVVTIGWGLVIAGLLGVAYKLRRSV